jgi:hypothetical protein
MSRQLDQIASDAAANNWSFSQALESLTELELQSRNQNAIERRFRMSCLQARHSIDGFNFKHHKSRMEIKARVVRLLDLEFFEKGTSVVIGNAGRSNSSQAFSKLESIGTHCTPALNFVVMKVDMTERSYHFPAPFYAHEGLS